MKILLTCAAYPEPDTNAGDLRLWELIRMAIADGHHVTVLAVSENESRYRALLEELNTSRVGLANDNSAGFIEMPPFHYLCSIFRQVVMRLSRALF